MSNKIPVLQRVTETIQVKVTKEEKKQFDELARQQGRFGSSLAREWISRLLSLLRSPGELLCPTCKGAGKVEAGVK